MATFDDKLEQLTGKGMDARTAKWSAMTNVLGVIIGAVSVIAALSDVCRFLPVIIILVGFLGIVALMRCFGVLHKSRVESIEN